MLHDSHVPRHWYGVGRFADVASVWRNDAVLNLPSPVVGNCDSIIGDMFHVLGQRKVKVHNPYTKGGEYIRSIFLHKQMGQVHQCGVGTVTLVGIVWLLPRFSNTSMDLG